MYWKFILKPAGLGTNFTFIRSASTTSNGSASTCSSKAAPRCASSGWRRLRRGLGGSRDAGGLSIGLWRVERKTLSRSLLTYASSKWFGCSSTENSPLWAAESVVEFIPGHIALLNVLHKTSERQSLQDKNWIKQKPVSRDARNRLLILNIVIYNQTFKIH